MPLDGGPWEAIEKQREQAVDLAPETPAAFWDTELVGGYSRTLFQQAGGADSPRRIPLSYYSKASAWATDYPLIRRRVMGYINPDGFTVTVDGRNRVLSLEEYVLREFGCRVETLERLVADGLFVPLLDRRKEYPPHVTDAIADLFDGVRGRETSHEIEPRFVNIVDYALGAAAVERGGAEISAKYERVDGGDRVDIGRTVAAWIDGDGREGGYDPDDWHEWESLPTESFAVHGVEHEDLREYVVERAVKLELLDDVMDTFTADESARIGNIRETSRRFLEAEGTYSRDHFRTELISRVYLQWNQLGVPAYYCDFSNTVDIGPSPLQTTWLSRFRSWLRSLYERLKREYRSVASRIRLDDVETHRANPTTVPLPAVDGVRFGDLFSIGPDDVARDDWNETMTDLAARADAYHRYYGELAGSGFVEELGEPDSYVEAMDRQVRTAEGDTYVRQMGTSLADVIVIGDTAETVLGLDPDLDGLLGGLEAAADVAGPSGAGILAGVGTAALQVPAYHVDASDVAEPTVKTRNDVTYGDVWGFPYGDRGRLMNRLSYVTRESIVETMSLPSNPLG